jgi:hypothetical protein
MSSDTSSVSVSLPNMSDVEITSDVSDGLPFQNEPNPFQQPPRVKEPHISVDDYIKNEEWASQTVSFVQSHYGALRDFQVKTVPLYRKKFKNLKDFMASKGTIQDLILRGLPDDVSVSYHSKDGNGKVHNRAISKVAYYFMRIRDAVYPEANKEKRVKEWALLAKRERDMMDFMDSHREKMSHVEKEEEEDEDEEGSTTTTSTSTTGFVKSVKKDEDGIEFWITYYQTNYPEHYPEEELRSAIRDMWFEDTKPFVYRPKYVNDREDTIKISKCGFYLYDLKKKINIRRSSIPMIRFLGCIIGCNVDELCKLNLEFEGDIDEFESNCFQIDDCSIFFSKTLMRTIPHSTWDGCFLKPEQNKVPKDLQVVRNTMGRGVIDAEEDFFITDFGVVESFLRNCPLFQVDECKIARYYDPCCGAGIFGTVLRSVFNNQLTIIEKDKFPKEQFQDQVSADYLNDEDRASIEDYDIMICNPPFSIKSSFLECAYKVGKFFCMLLPLDTLMSGQRMALFKTYGVEVYLIAPDASFIEGKTGREVRVRCGWFVWFPEMMSNPSIKIDYSIVGSKVNQTFNSYMSKYNSK